MHRERTHVLVAGGGVAALEAAIALQKLAGDLVDVELLSPAEYFYYRPLAVTLPFDAEAPVRFDLSDLARMVGASVTRGALTGIDAWRRQAHTSTNHDVEYDVLLVACGALPMLAVKGASTFRGSSDAGLVRRVLDEIARGEVLSVAFVVPGGPTWPLPAYDLALLAGSHAPPGAEVWLVTPEKEPLQLFGPPASAVVRQLLAVRGVEVRTDVYAESFANGQLELSPDEPLHVDRVIALPRLAGARSTAFHKRSTDSSRSTTMGASTVSRMSTQPATLRASRSSMAAWRHSRPSQPRRRSPRVPARTSSRNRSGRSSTDSS